MASFRFSLSGLKASTEEPICDIVDDPEIIKITERLITLSQQIRDGKALKESSSKPVVVSAAKDKEITLSSSLDPGVDTEDTYVVNQPTESASEIKAKAEKILLSKERLKELDSLAVGAKLADVRPKLGKKALKKLKQAEREKTKGEGWSAMKAPEMTDELKRDLEVLQMRGAIDPKRFYKKNDAPPKYFQVGQVIDAPVDFYNDRVPKKDRKKTLVDELMADAEFRKFSKRKYAEIIEEKSKYQRKYQGKGKKKKKA